MARRFLSIWFRHLKTDWLSRRRPSLLHIPFALAIPDRGRKLITAVNDSALKQGIFPGNVVADAKAIVRDLQVFDDRPELANKLLNAFAKWCIRYTPLVAIDPPDGLILDVTGCAHLWGSESAYITDIINRFKSLGYNVRAAMADTIGAAWAVARFGQSQAIIETGQQTLALLSLPPAALRLEAEIVERLDKLGLRQINNFIGMPRSALRRRFGQQMLRDWTRLWVMKEVIHPVQPIEPYQERLPCLEPIVTATGIEIALQRFLKHYVIACNKNKKDFERLHLNVIG